MRLTLLYTFFATTGWMPCVVFCQEWTLVKTITQPGLTFYDQGGEEGRLGLFDGRLVYTSGGSLFVHQRNMGGVDEWQVTDIIGPESIPGSPMQRSYGGAVVVQNGGIYVGSTDGTWRFSSSPMGMVREFRIDTLNALAMVASEELLCISSSTSVGVIVKCWDAAQLSAMAEPIWFHGMLSPMTPGTISCYGDGLCQSRNRLIITDPCYSWIPYWRSGRYTVANVVDEPDNALSYLWANPEEYIYGFGRSIAWKGDTIFAGVRESFVNGGNWLDVRRVQGDTTLVQVGVVLGEGSFTTMGYSLLVDQGALYVGTDRGFAIYQELDDDWQLQFHQDLGGPVTCMTLDDSHLAMGVAHPSGGRIHIFQRIGTGMSAGGVMQMGQLRTTPSPASNQVLLEAGSMPLDHVALYDLTGRLNRMIPWNGQHGLIIERGSKDFGVQLIRGLDRTGHTLAIGKIVWVGSVLEY